MDYIISVNENLCKGIDDCELCMHVCPKDVFEKSGKLTEKGFYAPEAIHIEKCTACKLCMIYCPDLCIVVERATEVKKAVAE